MCLHWAPCLLEYAQSEPFPYNVLYEATKSWINFLCLFCIGVSFVYCYVSAFVMLGLVHQCQAK